MHSWGTPGQAPISVCTRDSRAPSGKRLSKLGTTVSVDLGPPGMNTLLVLTLEVNLEEEWRMHIPRDNKPVGPQPCLVHLMEQFPGIWDQDGQIGLAMGHPPILVTITPGANPVHQRQYPIPLDTWRGIALHIQHLCNQGILTSCQRARVQ
jgi:hypothetical protein